MNLPTVRAHKLAEHPQARRWLIDQLWADEAVGIVGGEPKCCKSFLAFDIAVSVAGGVPCLRRFTPAQTGRVLLFAAEDALHVVRQRLAGIALAAGRVLGDLDIHVISAPSVAPLLAYLREIQRRFHVAVVLVHHARKGGAKLRAGQALRGSSEFQAWGDSNLYLRRHGDQLTLSVEHRAAAGITATSLELAVAGDAVALTIADREPARSAVVATATPITLTDKLETALAAAAAPLTAAALRKLCQVRNATLTTALAELVATGRVRKDATGYALAR